MPLSLANRSDTRPLTNGPRSHDGHSLSWRDASSPHSVHSHRERLHHGAFLV